MCEVDVCVNVTIGPEMEFCFFFFLCLFIYYLFTVEESHFSKTDSTILIFSHLKKNLLIKIFFFIFYVFFDLCMCENQ